MPHKRETEPESTPANQDASFAGAAPADEREAIDAPPAGSDPQHPSPQLLLWAYRNAIFPMVDNERGKVEWFSPDPRAIVPLHPEDAFHIQKNLAREVRKGQFAIRCDTAFERVMRECAADRSDENPSWMDERLLRPYVQLFEMGHAHSIEAWLPPPHNELVGGLYGVHVGGAFFGESMFSRPEQGGSNSSKICLVHLVRWLRSRGFLLLDTQFSNPHLDQFGCVEIPARVYEAILSQAVKMDTTWGEFSPKSKMEPRMDSDEHG
jgi:leucyl/phenylalanyl-tRNA---protein transferase